MLRVASLLYSIISATFAGTLVIVALVSGVQTGETILMAAGNRFRVGDPGFAPGCAPDHRHVIASPSS